MTNVIYTSADQNEHFTKDKSYPSFITPDGLTILDDTGLEHVIATKRNPDKTYDGDTFFQNHFIWDESTRQVAFGEDPNWSIDCPECGHKHTDWQNYIDTNDMRDTFEAECEACGKMFDVKYTTTIEFATKSKNATEFNEKTTLDELFASWVEELGYHRAVLLSCNYPVSKVAGMSVADAEAEVEAFTQ